jgi:hypothetical protein
LYSIRAIPTKQPIVLVMKNVQNTSLSIKPPEIPV